MRLKSSARGSGPGLASPNPTDIAIGAGRGKAAAAGSPVAAASCSRLRSLAAKQAKDIGLDAFGRTLPYRRLRRCPVLGCCSRKVKATASGTHHAGPRRGRVKLRPLSAQTPRLQSLRPGLRRSLSDLSTSPSFPKS